ncbi:monooxygenase [Halomonas sp. MCCC 1A11036]|uniref:Monooxygenase n=1 Tax=Billgrantia zhangzhouensis TaxID=2733481 RepID=A0ABS9A9Y3_9GAMM|nr:FAD-dependent monooxygenase [Halomonas zhangzhouensis]MCE8018740.1 monooxygenase [Halomonas zhangzhouensis]
MKISVLGGGPSGLYFAYLARKRLGKVEVHVHERNAPNATFGFGVVLAGSGLARLEKADTESFARLCGITKRLGNQEIILNGQAVSIGGKAYGGAVERLQLLKVLQELCAEVGVHVSHHDDIKDVEALEDADLLVGADGANSTLRRTYSHSFGTHDSQLSNSFAWYGAERVHDRPTLSFRNAGGGAFCAHYYPYTNRMCTYVMECDRAAWEGCGFGEMTEDERQAFVEELYAEELQGVPLISNKSEWRNFQPVWNDHWTYGHRVLIGDAVRRAHFSIGSGTRIAMEDSIALVQALETKGDIQAALATYVATRKPAADKLIGAAQESYTWYEEMSRHMQQADTPHAFALDYLTRTSRVDTVRVASEYPAFMKALEAERMRLTE